MTARGLIVSSFLILSPRNQDSTLIRTFLFYITLLFTYLIKYTRIWSNALIMFAVAYAIIETSSFTSMLFFNSGNLRRIPQLLPVKEMNISFARLILVLLFRLGNRFRLRNRFRLGNRSRLGNRFRLRNRFTLGNRSRLGNRFRNRLLFSRSPALKHKWLANKRLRRVRTCTLDNQVRKNHKAGAEEGKEERNDS